MKVILLKGKSNVGKTTTLNELIKKLSKEYHIVPEYKNRKKDNGKDCVAKFNINGITIGIITAGDKLEIIERYLKLIGDVDYLVAASHTYGDTLDIYKKCDSNAIEILKSPSDDIAQHKKDNTNCANYILEIFENLLKEVEK